MILRIFLFTLSLLLANPFVHGQRIVNGPDETFYSGPEWTVNSERGIEYLTYRIQMNCKVEMDSLLSACQIHFNFFKGSTNNVDQIRGRATYYFNDHCTTVNVFILITYHPEGELVINIRPENIRPNAKIGPKYWYRYFFNDYGHYESPEPESKYFLYVTAMEDSAESFKAYVK